MRQHFVRSRPLSATLVGIAFAWALLAAGSGTAQSSLVWGIEERAARGCVDDVSVVFDAAGALGGHRAQPLCGATAVRLYPEPLPTGTLTVSFTNRRGEPRRFTVPLDAVFRRDSVRMEQSVLQLVYGQDSLEVWVRPLATAPAGAASAGSAADETQVAKLVFFGGLELDAAPPPPGISRSR